MRIFPYALLLCLKLTAQNLIENPGFETTSRCIISPGAVKYGHVAGWSSPTYASPDAFSSCDTTKFNSVRIPQNFMGIQFTKEGTNYIGLYLYTYQHYTEYAQGTLTQTLEKGGRYRLTVHVNLALKSDFAINHLNVLFLPKHVKLPTDRAITSHKLKKHGEVTQYTEYALSNGNFLEDTFNWTPLTLEFTAAGFENVIVLGNVESNRGTETKLIKNEKHKEFAYYYIDDLHLERIDKPTTVITNTPTPVTEQPTVSPVVYQPNTTYTFTHVVFDYNSTELSDAAKAEIKLVYDELSKHPDYTLTINGHTDYVGGADFNLDLSNRRAQAVANYFTQLGLDTKKITAKGFGDTQPVTTNDTEAGRAQNRRVEFVLVKAIP